MILSSWLNSQPTSQGLTLIQGPTLVSDGVSDADISIADDIGANSDLDTDKDGLKDWEENIWNTDPQSSDSDKDGTPDGAEVKVSRNPTVKGPNDKLSEEEKQNIGSTAIAKGFTANSITDNFSKTFFQDYLGAKQQDQVVNSDGTVNSDIITSLVTKATQSEVFEPHYSSGAINTLYEPTPLKLHDYGESFAEIQEKRLSTILALSNEGKNPEILALEYKGFAEDIMKLQVPGEISLQHVKIANNLYTSYEAYITLAKYEKDPLKALLAIKKLKEISVEQPMLYTDIAEFFKKNGIIFGNTDSGALWNKF
jgi:hypothetical protein